MSIAHPTITAKTNPWKLQDLIGLLEAAEDAKPRERGAYKKRGKDLHSN